jgi:AraC-like DNA-binding protein
LRIPVHQITDRYADAADLDLHWLRDVTDASDPVAGVRGLEQALLGQLDDAGSPNPGIAFAVEALLKGRPPTIEQLSASLGFTRQHLRRLFVSHVGIGPKQFARVARMQRAVLALQGEPRGGVASAAAAAGYFDEAHMDRDFGGLVGVTPRGVRAARGSIRPIPSVFGVA